VDIAQLVAEFGFPVIMVIGLGYFVYFVWQTITKVIGPAVQDMIRLQEKVNTVLKLREQSNDE